MIILATINVGPALFFDMRIPFNHETSTVSNIEPSKFEEIEFSEMKNFFNQSNTPMFWFYFLDLQTCAYNS